MPWGFEYDRFVAQQKQPADQKTEQCFCVGPRNGETLCPCQMRWVKIVDGRYVQTIDYGPVPDKKNGQPTGSEEQSKG